MNWKKINGGKIRADNVNAYEAMGFAYCSIACESLEQAKEIRKQILKKVTILNTGKGVN